ncbi:MAG: molybdate ABC transporter substrate-binding protein [Solirubrobacterales bacterium]
MKQLKLIAAVATGVATVAFFGCGSSDSDEEPLTIGAASSLRTALADYRGPEGSSLPPIRISFAGSDLIASQIKQGAGIDVFAAASTTDPDALYEEGLVEKPLPYAGNEVVVAVPKDSQIDSIEDLAKPGTDLVVGGRAVPVGAYTREILDGLPAQEGEAITDNIRSEEPDVASITAKLVQGAADAGFIYSTDVLSAPDDIKAIEIPADLQAEVVYSAAVVKDADNPDAAQEYIDGLLSGSGADDLTKAGFQPAP